MRGILLDLLDIYYSEEFKGVKKISGNIELGSIVLGNPKYMEAKAEYCKGKKLRKNNQGKKLTLQEDGYFLVHCVKNLYERNQEEYDSERTLNDSIRAALVGKTDKQRKTFICRYFFDTHDKNKEKKHHWIDTLSGMNCKFGLFGGEDGEFSEFINAYNEMYLKMDNRKMEPFYPRSLSDLCAVYTIFTCHTCSFYKKMRSRLDEARQEGLKLLKGHKNGEHGICSDTETIRTHFVEHIFDSYGRDEEAVIEKLEAFIRNNPTQFDVERHYYAIRELLTKKIIPSDLFEFNDEEMLERFCSSDVDYKEKDGYIVKFDYEVFYCLYGSQINIKNERRLFKMLVNENRDYELIHDIEEIRSKNDNYKTEALASSSVLSMLRHLAILLTVKDVLEKNNDAEEAWEVISREDLMASVNKSFLSELGLVNLGEANDEFCTDQCKVDWCISKLIDNHYKELENRFERQF